MLHHTCKILIIILVHINVHIHVDILMLTNNYVHSFRHCMCTTCPPCWNRMETWQFSGKGNRVKGAYICMFTYMYVYYFHVGVENNDTSKRGYFSSNRHNAPAEITRSDFRLESLKCGVGGSWKLSSWKKEVNKSNEYWNEGGFQVSKHARISSSSHEPEPRL